jgi:hypothetical protein
LPADRSVRLAVTRAQHADGERDQPAALRDAHGDQEGADQGSESHNRG